jgi:hypothetical protein
MYSVYYISYFESALRQILAALVALAVVLPGILDKNTRKTVFGTICVFLLHYSGVVILVFPLVNRISDEWFLKLFGKFKLRYFGIFIAISAGLLGLSTLIFSDRLIAFVKFLPASMESRLIGYFAFGVSGTYGIFTRLFLLLVILYMFNRLVKNQNCGRSEILFMKIYLGGFLLYCALYGNSIFASRINLYFKIIEIVFIPLLFYKCNFKKYELFAVFSVTALFLAAFYAKEVSNALSQTDYYNPSYWNYPYFTYLNKSNFLKYRPPDPKGFVFFYVR